MLSLLESLKFLGQSASCINCTDSITWRDIEGQKVVKVKVIKEGIIGKAGWNNSVSASYSMPTLDSVHVVNTIKQSASGIMEEILYAKGTVRLIDIDNDSIVEAYFFYEIEKDGLDDNVLKLICFYKSNKIVVLGNVPKQSERSNSMKFVCKGAEDVSKTIVAWLMERWKHEAHKRMQKYINELE